MASLAIAAVGGLAYAAYKKRKKPRNMEKREYYLDEDWEYYPESISEIYLQTNKKKMFIACDEDGKVFCVDDKYDPQAAFVSIPLGTTREFIALQSRQTGLYLDINEEGEVIGVDNQCYFKIKAKGNSAYLFQSQNGAWLCFDSSNKVIIAASSSNSTKFFVGNTLVDQTVDKWKFPMKNDILQFNSPQCVSCARIPDGNYVVVQQTDDEDSDPEETEDEEDDEPEEKEEPDQWDVKFIKNTGEWINIFGEQVISKGHIKRWHIKIIPKFVPSSPYAPGRIMSAMEKVPVVGYSAAAFHLVRGRGDYAKKAAAKCTNSTIVAGAVIATGVATGGTGFVAMAGAGAVAGAGGVFAESQIAKTIKDDQIKDQCLQGTAKDYVNGMAKGAVKGVVSAATAGLAEGADGLVDIADGGLNVAQDAIGNAGLGDGATDLLNQGAEFAHEQAMDKISDLAEAAAEDNGFMDGMQDEMKDGMKDVKKETDAAAQQKALSYLRKKKAANPYPEEKLKDDVVKGRFGKKRPKDHIANVIVGIANVERLGQNGGYFLKPCKGYGYYGKTGRRLRKKSKKKYGPKSYVYDIITVELNMESLELGFFINDEFQGTAYKVNKKKSYCLAISLNSPYYEAQLV